MANKLYSEGTILGRGTCDGTLTDPALLNQLASYKRRVASNYRPLAPADIDKLAPGKMIVSEKIDGELWFLIAVNNEVFLANPRGSVIAGALPFLTLAGKPLPERTIIAGELHAIVAGKRCRVGDLAAALSGGAKAKVGEVAFSAFDLVEDAGVAPVGSYSDRHVRLQALIGTSPNLSVVPIESMGAAVQVRDLFSAKIESSQWEGLVLRLEMGLIYKLKPAVSVDAVVIGYTTKADQSDLARSILLGLMHENGQLQILGACGNLGSEDERRELLRKLVPLKTPSQVRVASDTGGLYTFMQPQIVVEVNVTDLQGEKSGGGAQLGTLINHTATGWISEGMKPCPRPIHPVLVRVRTDKNVNPVDIRFAQVAAYLPSGDLAQAESVDLPKSTLLRREVWTKEAKGQVAIRKLLIWKTNKEKIATSYPAYVVHWTDYSPTRAEPLDRDVRLAPDEAEAAKIAEALIGDNIKKGWNKL